MGHAVKNNHNYRGAWQLRCAEGLLSSYWLRKLAERDGFDQVPEEPRRKCQATSVGS